MSRRIAHFSCGAASAIATKISNPDEIWYAKTGGEDVDNYRFLRECETFFGQEVKVLQSKEFSSTWEVWEKRRYLAGTKGAPCTRALKVLPLVEHAEPEDVNIVGYTKGEAHRIKQIRAISPENKFEFPLIDHGLDKPACLALLAKAGIKPPRVYDLGFHNANCIPCVKAAAPGYWALIREHFPEEFDRMDKLSKELGVKLIQFSYKKDPTTGKRVKVWGFLSDLPEDVNTNDPIVPACDLLCTKMSEYLEEGEG